MSDIEYIRRNLKGMAVSGFWDYFKFKNPVKRILFAVYGKLVYFTFVCFNLSQFIEMYYVREDFAQLMQNASVTLLYGVLIFKTYTIMFRTNRIEQLLERIRREEHRAFKRPQEEVDTYNESIQQNWAISRLFWFVCSTTVFFYFIARPMEYFALGPQEIYNYKIPLVFSSWFPFDKFSDEYFIYAFTYQIYSGCIGAYYVAMCDTLFVAFMIFAIGQFRLMQVAIRNLHNLTENEQIIFSGADILDIYEKVVDVVKHHCRIIDYLDDLDNLLNPIMLMNFLICSIIICSVGLEGIIAGPSIRFVLSIYFLLALLIQLFLYYWHANEVTEESMNVGQAVCESEWFKFSWRVKQALLMILIRAQRPSILSVGGFYAMSLNTFLMILRATYSYLALFRRIYSSREEE